MSILKKISAMIITLTLVLSVIIIPTGISANAATSGNYTYTISGNSAIITDCKESIKGAVTIPNKLGGKPVTEIAANAFKWCDDMTSVKLPATVKTIGDSAFSYCWRLKKVTLSSGVTTIGDYAFSGDDALTSINIPSTVTKIGENAFWSCDVLPTITIPAKVTEIGDYAFGACRKLKTINVNANNTAYSSASGVLFNKNKTLLIAYPAGKTGNYTIPATVNEIENSAFQYSLLTSITIPANVTTIDSYAFANSDKLTTIKFHSGLNEIPDNVCFSCDKLTSVTIPNGIKAIERHAFQSCKALKTITIPASVELIGGEYGCPQYVFDGAKSLKTINVNSANQYYSSADGVLFSKDKKTLYVCPEAKSGAYTVPGSVTTISRYAFYTCKLLTKVTLPTSLEIIDSYAFSYCDKLTSLTLPKNVCTVELSAFAYSNKLANINVASTNTTYASISGVLFSKDKKTLLFYPVGKTGTYTVPSGVKTLAERSFYYNSNLTRIYFPTSITTIENFAFGTPAYKEKLVHYYYNGKKSAWKSKVTIETDYYGTNYNKRLTSAAFHDNTIKSVTPKLTSVSNIKAGVKFNWKKVSGAEGYVIYRKLGSGAWKKLTTVYGAGKYTYTDKTAKKGKTYRYSVQAFHGAYKSKYNTTGLKIKRK